MNSPFLGQQVGNCKSFTWTHYLANVFAMHCGPRKSKPIVHPTLYPTHISFIPSQSTFPFLKYGYQKFDLENPRSRSWVRSKFKVTTWVQHPTDSHPFGSMSIHPVIPMIELFLNLTFKIQGQSHSSRSHSGCSILSIHISFVPCWSILLFLRKLLRYSYFQNWPWKSKPEGQGHGWGHISKSQCESNIRSTHILLVSCQSALSFPRYRIFNIWPWKSKVKVIAQGHRVGITPYRLLSLSFHVDRPYHSWDTAISTFDIEN